MNKTNIQYLTDKVIQYKDNKNWYRDSNKVIKDMFGNDYKDFIYLLAVTSPRNSVNINTLFAIRAYTCIKQNKPHLIKYGICHKTIYGNIKRVSRHDYKHVTGIKVRAFIDSLLLKDGSICIDIWMRKVYNIKHVTLSKRDISRITKSINTIAKRLNMYTYEVQACLWSYAKSELNNTQFKEYKDFTYYLKKYNIGLIQDTLNIT